MAEYRDPFYETDRRFKIILWVIAALAIGYPALGAFLQSMGW